jgi:hypothetical protein
MTSLDITKYEEKLEQIFSQHHVTLAYLFGSQARGKAGPLSDVDIAVLLNPEVDREEWSQIQIDLMGKLMSLFQRNDVDVVILNQAKPVLAHQVALYGRVLYQAQPGARADFEVAALRRYVDTEPLRRIQDHCFLKRVEKYRAAMQEV